MRTPSGKKTNKITPTHNSMGQMSALYEPVTNNPRNVLMVKVTGLCSANQNNIDRNQISPYT